ncbi:MAG TPA: molybdopterin synthase sulfur carrier subunit [Clostridiales bacterium]|jgi:molybdopterin converting factor small subunit|nr:molybdopterin synthase sulfur carrier subunit [Clostridiales bacterium]
MAKVKFLPPLNQHTTKEFFDIEADTLLELCLLLLEKYRLPKTLFFSTGGGLSKDIVILINRRNAHTLEGLETPLHQETEVLVMRYFVGG